MTKKLLFWFLPVFVAGLITLAGLTGCKAGLDQAAAGTATALIGNAQATARVMQAQAMSTALVKTMSAPTQAAVFVAPGTPVIAPGTPTPAPDGSATPESTPGQVEIVAVTTAADGVYIMIQFRAPVRIARTWYQGRVGVIDEATGTVYSEIPSVGTIGPLITHPSVDGQLGFIMLTNKPVALQAGAHVTVILGDIKQEHIIVQ